MTDDPYYRDQDGKILRYSNGEPVLLDHFANDPSDTYFDKISKMSTREWIDETLAAGNQNAFCDTIMENSGYVRVDGKWVYRGKKSSDE
jgi:hypothetical protein